MSVVKISVFSAIVIHTMSVRHVTNITQSHVDSVGQS